MEELKTRAKELLGRYADEEELTEELLEDAMNIIAEFVEKA